MALPLEIHVQHDLSELAPLRRRLHEWLEGRGLADPPRAGVVLAAHEAIANAIEHSNSPRPILVRAEASSDGFVIEITDDGEWKIPEVPSKIERGRGLDLMRALVSDVKVTSRKAGTTIRLFQHA